MLLMLIELYVVLIYAMVIISGLISYQVVHWIANAGLHLSYPTI